MTFASILRRLSGRLARSSGTLLKTAARQIGSSPMRPYYYLGGNRALTQLSTGQPFFVNTDDRGITTWIILGGLWETFVDDILWELAEPGMAVLDVGANMGYYSIKLGGRIGATGTVYSFEPNPELNSFLHDNININGFTGRVKPFNCALGSVSGRETLYFPYENMGGGTLAGPGANSVTVEVDVETLDDCLPAGTRVDLAKIDAEGYEPKIMLGAQRMLQENPHLVMVLEVNLLIWRMFSDPLAVLQAYMGAEREIFAIQLDGRIVAHGDAANFLKSVDDNFVAYCLIGPRSANLGTRFAAKLVRP